ncbi:hypothetical protein ABZ297_39335 [Nonomuraea sp. NPDC005983]|uniref:hypothetical protein n=1 Tax=Nonomuraea sp. NPDC005983 TaxID=3155595 RepID=UPI0033A568E5
MGSYTLTERLGEGGQGSVKGAGEWRFFWDADGRSVGPWVGYEAVVVDLRGQAGPVVATASKPAEFDKMGFRYTRGTP